MTTARYLTAVAKSKLMLVLILSVSHFSSSAESRTWQSADGKFSVDAELLDYSDDDARLKKTDGRTITVPLEKLAKADVRFLQTRKDNLYRIGGMFRIKNVGRGVRWEVVSRDSDMALLATRPGINEKLFTVLVVAQGLKREPTSRERAAVSAVYFEQQLEANAKRMELKTRTIGTKTADGSQLYYCSATFLRPDGRELSYYGETFYRLGYAFHVQGMVIQGSKLRAEELVHVGLTIEEASPVSTE